MEEWKRAVEIQEPDLIRGISLRRKASKSGAFGTIFGCSGAKLAGMLKIPEEEGNEKKNNFLQQMGLDNVQKWLKTCKERFKRGSGFYIPLPFGYWVYCSQDHKAINYLIQGTEAIMEKMAEVYIDKQLVKKGLCKEETCGRILSMHDECLFETSEEEAHEVGKLCTEAFTWAGQKLYEFYKKRPEMFPNVGGPEFAIDLAGGYDVGDNYSQAH